MSCKELIDPVSLHQKKTKLDCPLSVVPKCHPKQELFRVHVDGKRRIIFLSCPKCDKPISIIRLKGPLNKGMKLKE